MFEKNKVIQFSKRDCLVDLRNQVLATMTALEVEIEVLKSMPEDFIVGDKGVSQIIGGMQGKIAVKAKEAIELKLKQLFSFNKKLEAIDILLSKE